MKAHAPSGTADAAAAVATSSAANDSDAGEGGEPATPTKTPRKKGTATPRKNAVGPRGPKKATAPKAELKEEVTEDGDAKHESADEIINFGKSSPTTAAIDTFAPVIFQSGRRLPLVSSMCGYMATFPVGYSFPLDSTDEELYKAHLYQTTVEEWRVWKLENNYDPDRAITPC